MHGHRDLARTHPGKKNSKKNFHITFLGVIHKYFPNKPSSRTWLKCKLPLLTKRAIIIDPNSKT